MQVRRSFAHGPEGGWSSIALHLAAAEDGKDGFYLTLFLDGRAPAVVFLTPRQVQQLLDLSQDQAAPDHALWDFVAKVPLEPLLPNRSLGARLRWLLTDSGNAIRDQVRLQLDRRPPPSPVEPEESEPAPDAVKPPPWQMSCPGEVSRGWGKSLRSVLASPSHHVVHDLAGSVHSAPASTEECTVKKIDYYAQHEPWKMPKWVGLTLGSIFGAVALMAAILIIHLTHTAHAATPPPVAAVAVATPEVASPVVTAPPVQPAAAPTTVSTHVAHAKHAKSHAKPIRVASVAHGQVVRHPGPARQRVQAQAEGRSRSSARPVALSDFLNV